MDDYWNYIATPFFFLVLLFGGFVLFRVSKTQFSGPEPVGDIIKGLRKSMYPSTVPSNSKPTGANAGK